MQKYNGRSRSSTKYANRTNASLFPFPRNATNQPRPRPYNEFYKITFRKKLYSDIETLQKDLDEYIDWYNTERTHHGIRCKGRTPLETFIEGKEFYDEKNIDDRLVA